MKQGSVIVVKREEDVIYELVVVSVDEKAGVVTAQNNDGSVVATFYALARE